MGEGGGVALANSNLSHGIARGTRKLRRASALVFALLNSRIFQCRPRCCQCFKYSLDLPRYCANQGGTPFFRSFYV